MMKPFIKQRLFSRRSSGKKERTRFLPDAGGGLDASYLDEVSCFESLRAYQGRLFCLRRHVDRLWESCHALGRPFPFSKKELAQWIHAVLQESCFRAALLRVSIHWNKPGQGQVVAIVRPFISYPEEIYQRGVRLKTSANRRWTLKAQDPQIKSSQYVTGVLACLDMRQSPPHEAVFLNQDQCVAEGSVSNLFIVNPAPARRGGAKTILTPPASSGILRGVTRDVVIDLARQNGVAVMERPFTRHEVYSAGECFITNTSSEVLPVVAFDARRIGNGVPGPVTRKLLGCYRDLVTELSLYNGYAG